MPTFLGKLSEELMETAAAAGMCVCTADDSVPVGKCLIFVKGRLSYTGPIRDCPAPAGALTVMNPADMKAFADFCDKRLH